MKLDKYKELFFSEAEDKLSLLTTALLGIEKEPTNISLAQDAMIAAHTLKSSAAAMGYTHISGFFHAMEDLFEQVRSQRKEISPETIQLLFEGLDFIVGVIKMVREGQVEPDTSDIINKLNSAKTESLEQWKGTVPDSHESEAVYPKSDITNAITTIKVDVATLDSLMNLTEELMVERMRLEQLTRNIIDSTEDPQGELGVSVENISRLVGDLQYIVTQTHMVPLGQLFERFPRVVRDTAKAGGKKVSFEMNGQDIELDRIVVDKLGEPLVHLIRNAVDHGIDQSGTVTLSAERLPDRVEITVANTGKPIDWEGVVSVALKKNIISSDQAEDYIGRMRRGGYSNDKIPETKRNPSSLVPNEVIQLIYHPQLSTKTTVSETSGRGVGMAIVRSTVESLGGRVSIMARDNGTEFVLSLPLTVAIIQALLVRVADNIFALPFSHVDRIVRISSSNIKKAFDQEISVIGEQDIPMVRLSEKLKDNINASILPSNNAKAEQKDTLHKSELMVITKQDNAHQDLSTRGPIGLVVDEIFSEQDIVVKPLEGALKQARQFAGVTLLGDGNPALILDVTAFV